MDTAKAAQTTDHKKTRENYMQLLREAEVTPETTWAKVRRRRRAVSPRARLLQRATQPPCP